MMPALIVVIHRFYGTEIKFHCLFNTYSLRQLPRQDSPAMWTLLSSLSYLCYLSEERKRCWIFYLSRFKKNLDVLTFRNSHISMPQLEPLDLLAQMFLLNAPYALLPLAPCGNTISRLILFDASFSRFHTIFTSLQHFKSRNRVHAAS